MFSSGAPLFIPLRSSQPPLSAENCASGHPSGHEDGYYTIDSLDKVAPHMDDYMLTFLFADILRISKELLTRRNYYLCEACTHIDPFGSQRLFCIRNGLRSRSLCHIFRDNILPRSVNNFGGLDHVYIVYNGLAPFSLDSNPFGSRSIWGTSVPCRNNF